MNEDKKMFDSEHVYNILDKKKCFDSRCEEDFSKENHKEFCEFLELFASRLSFEHYQARTRNFYSSK